MNNKPNILYILTDQQSANMLSCMGTKWMNTPNIDRIAQKGILFSRAYCSNPVCLPSRFSLFTGHMPEKMGIRSNEHGDLPPIPRTILDNGMGHLFRNAGYKTVYGGKQHFPNYSAVDLGFDIISNDDRDVLAKDCSDFIAKKHDKPWLMVASCINPHDICYKPICDWLDSIKMRCKTFDDGIEHDTMKQYDCIPDGIDKMDFFNNICPKAPNNATPQEDEPEIIDEFINQRDFKRYVADNYSKNDWQLYRYVYKMLTQEMDKQVGIVLDALDNSPYKDNTMVVFTSDHGEMAGCHRLQHKTVLYEESINIPLIISHKNLPQGTKSDMLCSNALDLIPTLLNFAKIEVPDILEGIDILKAYNNEIPQREYVPIECEIGRGIICKDYKYILYDYGKNNEQLYDYISDKYEMKNHIKDKGNEETLNDMRNVFNKRWSKEQREENTSPLLDGKIVWELSVYDEE